MKRIIFVLLFLILLSGCTSQEVPPEPDTWTWVFYNGVAVDFPDTWRYIEYDGFAEGGTMVDAYGIFYMVRDGRSHEAAIEWFNEEHETVTEVESDGTVRFLRTETTRELYPHQYFGITDFVDYLVLAPDDTVFHAWFPVTSDIETREAEFRNVLETARLLHEELQTFGFVGGLAVMAYSSDWEIVNWMSAGAPNLQNDNLYLTILLQEENFWMRVIERSHEIETEEITNEDIIRQNLFLYSQYDAAFISLEHLDHQITTYQTQDETVQYYVFRLENKLWFSIAFTRLDDEAIQPEDEDTIMRMIDSILLNNRDSYYEPIRLRFP